METITNLHFAQPYWEIVLPLILMVADIVTGYYQAWKNNNVKSAKMRDGIGKKIAELVYIIIGMVIGIAFNIKLVGEFVSLYIVYMELVSIAENCKKLGVDMPDGLKDKLNNDKEWFHGNKRELNNHKL